MSKPKPTPKTGFKVKPAIRKKETTYKKLVSNDLKILVRKNESGLQFITINYATKQARFSSDGSQDEQFYNLSPDFTEATQTEWNKAKAELDFNEPAAQYTNH